MSEQPHSGAGATPQELAKWVREIAHELPTDDAELLRAIADLREHDAEYMGAQDNEINKLRAEVEQLNFDLKVERTLHQGAVEVAGGDPVQAIYELRAEVERLASLVRQYELVCIPNERDAEVERLQSESASLTDVINTALRENYGSTQQLESASDDKRQAIWALVDGARHGARFESRAEVERLTRERDKAWDVADVWKVRTEEAVRERDAQVAQVTNRDAQIARLRRVAEAADDALTHCAALWCSDPVLLQWCVCCVTPKGAGSHDGRCHLGPIYAALAAWKEGK
jgi:hypothetical protein